MLRSLPFVHWSLILDWSVATPPPLDRWRIITLAFRENLQWAVVVESDAEISAEVGQLLDELSARGITVHHARLGSA